ncbi:MAG: glycoside hydrolase family 2 [Acidobacteriota bacterium]|nr:glycoside hydrolase family 2 [Acidobacteriota bacterium]
MEPSSTTVPRPEYPRPQFERNDWLNLNGEWEFTFDVAKQGLDDGWHDGRAFADRITIPFPYQSELSGINDKAIHEVVWYARSFEVPPEWRDGDVLLHFGAVDYSTTVWVNGQLVGRNRGGHVPFWFDIAPYLRDGNNRLTVRVEDSQDALQPRGKQSSSGLPQGIDYYCTTGIWQTVWLERAPPIRIQELKITSSIGEGDCYVELGIYLHAPYSTWEVEAEILDGGVAVDRHKRSISTATTLVRLSVPDAKLWSPESPHLYDLRINLFRDGRRIDSVKSYVGLRSVELREGQMLLNGLPVFLRMVLDQGYWPGGYLAAPSDEALRADVEWVKRFGFNGVRKHQKIEDPRWLYWCDRLGLLVWEEMPNARTWSLEAEESLMAEWRRAVRRDFNHPCIITWVPINESMGFPELKNSHPGQHAFLERIVTATRRIDPTRPVIDNDGWEHTDITDICAIHDYTPAARGLQTRYQGTLRGGRLPNTVWYQEKPLFLEKSKYWGQPVMLTEVGGFLMLPQGIPVEQRDKLYQVYDSFGTPEELVDKYRDLMEGIASLPFLAGFCYTQLTDIEQEINGLLTYDRKPKVPPECIAEIHRRAFAAKSGGWKVVTLSAE